MNIRVSNMPRGRRQTVRKIPFPLYCIQPLSSQNTHTLILPTTRRYWNVFVTFYVSRRREIDREREIRNFSLIRFVLQQVAVKRKHLTAVSISAYR